MEAFAATDLLVTVSHHQFGFGLIISNGFNRVRAVRSHRAPPKIDQKVAQEIA